jgi:AcrR family transcriptional regulator
MHLKASSSPRQRLTRDESRQQTQALLREAALRQFALHGVAGTSAERIAEAAGFTRGAFYANFANKGSLLLDLMRRKMAAESPHWVRLADESVDVETALRGMDERAREFDPDGLWALISIELYLCALRDPAFAEQYKTYHEGIRSVSCLFLSRMFQREGKRPPAPFEDLAEILLGLSMTLSLPSPSAPEPRPRANTAEMLLVVLRGFLAAGQPVARATSTGKKSPARQG